MTHDADSLSLRALAKALGRARSGLAKLAEKGQIPRNPDGTFNRAAVERALARNVDPGRGKGGHPPAASGHLGGHPEATPNRTLSEEEARQAMTLIQRVLAEEGGDLVDYGMARTAETILKARERELKVAERKKLLVPLDKVKAHVSKAFTGYRQAIQQIPARHSAQLAAALGCDPGQLQALLSKAIAETLQELSAPVVRS